MDYEYMFEYRDSDGDEYSSEMYTSLADCRGEMKRLMITGCDIIRTFRYISGEYMGSFNF